MKISKEDFDGYIEKYLETFGIIGTDWNIDWNNNMYYNRNYRLDNEQSINMWRERDSLHLYGDNEGVIDICVLINNSCDTIYFCNRREGYPKEILISFKEKEDSLELTTKLFEEGRKRQYSIQIRQSLIGNVEITYSSYHENHTIPINIGNKQLSIEEYLEIIKDGLYKITSKETAEVDKKWIDAMISDLRLQRFLQKTLESVPKTVAEINDFIIDKRDKKLKNAKKEYKEKISKVDKKYKKKTDKAKKKYRKRKKIITVESDIAVDRLISFMESNNQNSQEEPKVLIR